MNTIPTHSRYKAAFESVIELIKASSSRELTAKEQRNMNTNIDLCRCYERHHNEAEVQHG